MFSIRDVPIDIEEKYKLYKKLSLQLFKALKKVAQQIRLPANCDLLEIVGDDKFAFIVKGYFKLRHPGKVVRLYSEGDFVASDPAFKECRLISDFGSVIALLDRGALLKAVSADPKIQAA